MAGFKEVLKHSRNYFFASIATKGLAFISIPIYTRILSTNDYGIVSIFLGLIGIFSVVMCFSVDRSVSRYFYDQKDEQDFKRFVGTSSIASIAFFIATSLLLFLFADKFGNLVGLSKNTVYLIIPISIIEVIGLTFQQIYGPLKKSKTIAIASLFRVYLGFVFSVILILLFSNNKYIGQIIGQVIAGTLMIIYWLRKIKPYFVLSFDSSYLKYIFTYSVPLIPYALSSVIIAQFGKIALGSSQAFSDAGYYSIALAVSSIVSIIISIGHEAWNPYFMEYMNAKNYTQIDRDFSKIFKITVICALGIASFGKEIGLVLAKKEFTEALYLVPILTIGYVFYQFSYVYLRNFGYSKKTHFATIVVFISGLSNILLNIILIKKYGEFGVAISFTFSYIIMAFFGWLFNKYFVKLHSTPLKIMLVPLIIMALFYTALYAIIPIKSIVLSIFLKVILISFFIVIILWKDKKEIEFFLKRFLKH